MILTSSHTLRAEDHSEVSAANGPSLITASRLNRKMYTINKYKAGKIKGPVVFFCFESS